MNTMTADSRDTTVRSRARDILHRPMTWVLVICAGWAVARLVGVDRVPLLAGLLVPILTFTPYAAVVSVVLVVLTLAFRRWKAFGVALAVSAAFAAAVLPRAVGNAAPVAGGPVLRILTANLRLGQANPHALVGLVRRTHADLLSMQEFTPQAGAAFVRAGLGHLLPYKITTPLGSALGSALYARWPLHPRPMFQVHLVGLAIPHAELDVPGGHRVEVMAVHLAHPTNPTGLGQWNRAFVILPTGQHQGPVRILAGDFNATLDHTSLRRLIGEGYVDAANETGKGLIPTFRQWWVPPITLDHVLADARCGVRRVTVYGLPGSDHRAVFAELRLP
ncbi:endonuclease/exonuclease/phosphatase family protein [Actinoallomurus acanthiterrae]